jgi:hypothetical protein
MRELTSTRPLSANLKLSPSLKKGSGAAKRGARLIRGRFPRPEACREVPGADIADCSRVRPAPFQTVRLLIAGRYEFSTGTFKSHQAAGYMNLCDHAHTLSLRLHRSVDGSNRRLPASQPHRSACQVEFASTSLRSRKTKPPSRYRFPKTEQHAVSHHRRDFDLENLVP